MVTRVLWVVKGLGPGGAERLLCELARVLEPDDIQVECAFVLPYKDHLVGELEAAGVRCTCLSRSARDPRWPVRLRALIASGGFDVVHVHSPLPGSVARLAALTVRPRPRFVSTEHNTWPTFVAPTRWANRLTSILDTATFAVSEEVRDSVRGSAARRAVTLQHGIDVASIAEHRDRRHEIRVELGIGSDEPVIGTVANFRPQKDYPNLLAAAAQLRDRGVRFRLVAVGQGPLADKVRERRDQLGLQNHVVLTGFRADATALLGAADVFVLASAWEGLPVALMEALALGLPVVATDVGGVGETMRDHIDALLVPPGDATALADALERVLTDEPLRRGLAAAAASRAAEFDVRASAATIAATYRGLAEAEPPGPAAPKPNAPRQGSFEIREATLDDRPAMLELLGRSLGWDDDPRLSQFFGWKHDQNPFGASPMWLALDGDRMLGVRVFLRWEFVRGGQVVRAVRAVDTATDPDAQGRGVFRALTMHAADAMRADGVAMVFNTPNAQSQPGYLKMGWRNVGRYPVSARVAGPTHLWPMRNARVAADRWSQPLALGSDVSQWVDANEAEPPWMRSEPDVRALRTHTTATFLRWRYGNDLLGYRLLEDAHAAVIVRLRRRGDALELVIAAVVRGDTAAADTLVAQSLHGSGADYAIRTGPANLRNGFVPVPKAGPILTWRALTEPGMPPLGNWRATLGDLELM